MKRFGMMFAFAGMAAVLMAEAGDEAGAGGGEPVKPATTAVETAPAATGKEPVIPEAEQGTEDSLGKAGFAKTEDAGLNYSLNFLATHGFTADNPAVDAAMGGDFSLLKAELAAKGIQGWEQALALGEQAYGRAVEGQKAKQEAVGKVVMEIAENAGVDWEEAVAHVSSASNETKAALNGLMADPATAHIAAAFITSQFLESGNSEREPLAVTQNSDTNAKRADGGTLSRVQFTAEMRKLRESMGDSYLDSPQAQALYRRLG